MGNTQGQEVKKLKQEEKWVYKNKVEARLHRFQLKAKVTREKAPLRYYRSTMFIFPNLTYNVTYNEEASGFSRYHGEMQSQENPLRIQLTTPAHSTPRLKLKSSWARKQLVGTRKLYLSWQWTRLLVSSFVNNSLVKRHLDCVLQLVDHKHKLSNGWGLIVTFISSRRHGSVMKWRVSPLFRVRWAVILLVWACMKLLGLALTLEWGYGSMAPGFVLFSRVVLYVPWDGYLSVQVMFMFNHEHATGFSGI